MKITKENIENHFWENPYWKKYFLSKFPNWSADTWEEDVWSLFELNGYRYELERYSNNPKSKLYCAIKCIDLYEPINENNYDGFVIGYGDFNESSALQQMLISVICDFKVDFRNFK